MTPDYDRSVETVILLIFAEFMLIFGALLFEIDAGRLPFNPDSTYGLFLVLVSLQIITMGKTPFGDLHRSWAVVFAGLCAATLGMFTCFIPGVLTEVARVVVGIVLLGGGLSLLMQLFTSETMASRWFRAGDVLAQLTVTCALVYALSLIAGVITLVPGLVANRQTAIFLIAYGGSFFYLAWLLRKVAVLYPKKEISGTGSVPLPINRFSWFKQASLPLSPAILILIGLSLTLLGLLLFPVSLGVLQFSLDGQLGLMLTVMAVQIMVLGETPLGQLKRPLLMMFFGLVFAALGIVATIVPGPLTNLLQTLIGALNVGGGAKSLLETRLPSLRARGGPTGAASVPAVVKRLSATQTILGGLQLVFGVTMLVPGLIPGLLMAGILVTNGLLLLRLASILRTLAALQPGAT